ncbi:uncharacterized protein Z519_00879 [Cladophialophora bantiana CBS 173.52]|uniref:Uncharacterized protein n=1 Tax=Cladophialophora bantiana (strain ATCC 10958 / CBS 173.52 / CDC B-1940 / NIH 8579) TaxID=1442370 RepID=A0A0D2FAS0_CLAB1|nr:uncharacterized protein Z519_00879 [Cladophialophora bantiana CBS 173.52]KIW99216.1 hypothetical protein Z519_00879 [Cladophialophora bantiana CBS 173.52]
MALLQPQNRIPMQSDRQASLSENSEDWSRHGSSSTLSVSTIGSKDENTYIWIVMVEVDGRHKLLCRTQLDTGLLPSLISLWAAHRAEQLGLATIEPRNLDPIEGLVKGPKLSLLGAIRLKFFIDGKPYRHTFFVVDDDRYDMLLGAKFANKSGLAEKRTGSADSLPGHL